MVNLQEIESSDKNQLNYLRLPHSLLELLLNSSLSKLEMRVVLYLFREFQIRKKAFPHKINEISQSLSMSKSSRASISKAIDSLLEKKIIFRKKYRHSYIYSFKVMREVECSQTSYIECSQTNYIDVVKVATFNVAKTTTFKSMNYSVERRPEDRYKSLYKNIYKSLYINPPIANYIQSKLSHVGAIVNTLRKWESLQTQYGIKKLYLACLHYSENEFLDKIIAPPRAHEIIREYLATKEYEIEKECEALKFSAINKIQLAHTKILNHEELSDQDKSALFLMDEVNSSEELESMKEVILGIGDNQELFLERANKSIEEKLNRVMRVGMPLITEH